MSKEKVRRKYGEGSVFPRKDGRWVAEITLEDRTRKQFYFKTEKEAIKKARQAINEKEQGTLATGRQRKLKNYLEEWLEEVHKPSIRSTTYIVHSLIMRKHIIPAIGHLYIQKLTPRHVQSLYTQKMDDEHLSPGSVRNIHLILHKALANAVRWNLVSRNVCDLVTPPRQVKHEMRTLDREQAQKLLDAAKGGRLAALLTLAITTGMRLGELAGLRWADVDLEMRNLQVRHIVSFRGKRYIEGEPKTAKGRRSIVLPSFVVDVLIEHKKGQEVLRREAGSDWENRDLVFSTALGGFLAESSLRYHFHRLLKSAGLPRMRFHDLRHSAATILLGMGVHPKVVQELLGHSSIAMTMDTYSHVLPSMQKEAMEKMNDVFKKPS